MLTSYLLYVIIAHMNILLISACVCLVALSIGFVRAIIAAALKITALLLFIAAVFVDS